MPRPTGLFVSLSSVAIAVAMLVLLLLVSSFPYQEAYRDIDVKLRYVSDLSVSIDRLIGLGVRSRSSGWCVLHKGPTQDSQAEQSQHGLGYRPIRTTSKGSPC